MGLKYATVGGGSLGTANTHARTGKEEIDEIIIYARDERIRKQINKSHQNKVYFPGISLSPKVRAKDLNCTEDYREVNEADVIEIDTLANALGEVGEGIKRDYRNQPIIFTCKGMVSRKGYSMFPHEALEDILGEKAPLVFLYNAAFARAIIKGDVTFSATASKDINLAKEIAGLIATENYRIIEETDDVVGLETIAIMKNIVAIAMGMAESMGISRSTQSGILYEGRKETTLLGEKVGANPKTFSGIALEDFWLSGLGKESRNWQFGNQFSRDKQRGRFINMKSQISAVSAQIRKRKHRSLLQDVRQVYEDIVIPGVTDGLHDLLDAPFIIGRIVNAISRVPFPEASEGTFSIPLLLRRARSEGVTLPIVEELYKVVFRRGSREVAMQRILEAAN